MSEDIIKVNTKEALTLAEKKVNSIASISTLRVVSQPTFDEAAEAMATIRETKKFLKEKKDSILNPLKEATDNIKALFLPSETKLAGMETHLKAQIDGYVVKLRNEETKRVAEAEKAIDKGASIETVTRKMEKTQEKIAKIPTRKFWVVKLVDFSKVPDEFKVLDESKARKAAEAGVKVEGLEFVQEERVVNRF